MTGRIGIPTYTGSMLVELTDRRNALFVLGRNGSGKSALLAHLHQHHQQQPVRRVSAHRQTWFQSGRLALTSSAYRQNQRHIDHSDRQPSSRYTDQYSDQKPTRALFALLNQKRRRDSEGMEKYEKGGRESLEQYLSETPNPLEVINSLFRDSSLDVGIGTDPGDPDALTATRISTGQTYGIEQLSDGERNALLLASEVLTAPEGALLLLDEPERHLHRSIISPLLSGLFEQRPDCRFVIATHDLLLPQDCGPTLVLILRGCRFRASAAVAWDADLIASDAGIDDDLKIAIWGGRRTILCVEGTQASRDKQIYESIFPDVSVWPKGGCGEVERFVRSASSVESLHWLRVFGLVDGDRRATSKHETDGPKRVYRLGRYAVESIYYDTDLQRAVAKPLAELLDRDIESALSEARSAGVRSAEPMRSLITREEQEILDQYVDQNDIQAIISEFPIRKSSIPDRIAEALGFKTRKDYERAVCRVLRRDPQLRQHAAQMCGGLHTVLQTSDG